MAVVCFNGEYLEEEELKFTDFSRLRFADSLFESMLWYKGQIPLTPFHIQRLSKSAAYMGLFFPEINFREVVEELIGENELTTDVLRLRMTLYRNFGKMYTPLSDASSYLIECEPLQKPLFSTIENLGIYRENLKSESALSNLKSGNSLFYVLAKQFAAAHFYDEVLLLNTSGNVAEAASSNVFMVKNNKIYTPPLTSGCVDGVMRSYIMQNFLAEEIDFTLEDIKSAEEIFLTNAITLVQPVLKFDNHTLATTFSEEIISFTMQNLLNEV